MCNRGLQHIALPSHGGPTRWNRMPGELNGWREAWKGFMGHEYISPWSNSHRASPPPCRAGRQWRRAWLETPEEISHSPFPWMVPAGEPQAPQDPLPQSGNPSQPWLPPPSEDRFQPSVSPLGTPFDSGARSVRIYCCFPRSQARNVSSSAQMEQERALQPAHPLPLSKAKERAPSSPRVQVPQSFDQFDQLFEAKK